MHPSYQPWSVCSQSVCACRCGHTGRLGAHSMHTDRSIDRPIEMAITLVGGWRPAGRTAWKEPKEDAAATGAQCSRSVNWTSRGRSQFVVNATCTLSDRSTRSMPLLNLSTWSRSTDQMARLDDVKNAAADRADPMKFPMAWPVTLRVPPPHYHATRSSLAQTATTNTGTAVDVVLWYSSYQCRWPPSQTGRGPIERTGS